MVPVLVEQYETDCTACGANIDIALNKNVSITLSRDCSRFWGKDEVLTANWYHFSNTGKSIEEWHKIVSSRRIDVHLGTRKSSKTLQTWRIEDLMKISRKATVNPIWTVRLKDDVKVFPEVAVDKNDWNAGIPEGYDVLRYVNAWEAAGQISLLAKPSAFTLDS